MLLYASYQSNNSKMGLVEYQLIKDDIYVETWDKVPTGNTWLSNEIYSLMNNGYKWITKES